MENGESANLETRTCKCGCGMKFKCLPTSKNYYATRGHDPSYEWSTSDSKFYTKGYNIVTEDTIGPLEPNPTTLSSVDDLDE